MFRNANAMRGYTLLEIVIVLAIIAVIGGIATMNFNSMSKKAEAERQMRELQADLFTARVQSVQQGRKHEIAFAAESYSFKSYSSESDAAGTVYQKKNLPYPVSDADGETLQGETITFDTRGLSGMQTIRLADGDLPVAIDCVAVSRGRINIGKMKGEDCLAQ